ncbi:MAG: flavin reductase family protein [Deltaproteobacteria bacterium]|nr:flavin reductase family protein [Deltaproteobacteria bacterium]MBI3076000.1 flavin reductase family protein [Deltaproteobacteria bacterium]
MAIDKNEFRRVMGLFATGVTIVTTRSGDRLHGLTANAFCSVSLDPPLVLVCVDHRANSYGLIKESGVFAVNILADDQRPLSDFFASKETENLNRFENVKCRTAVTSAPIIDGCLGYADCRVVAAHEAGDHTIYVGQVEELAMGREARPLIFHRGRYTGLDHQGG